MKTNNNLISMQCYEHGVHVVIVLPFIVCDLRNVVKKLWSWLYCLENDTVISLKKVFIIEFYLLEGGY